MLVPPACRSEWKASPVLDPLQDLLSHLVIAHPDRFWCHCLPMSARQLAFWLRSVERPVKA